MFKLSFFTSHPFMLFALAPFTALPLLAGCTDIQSADVTTAGMSAQMRVTADGSGLSTAVAQINVDTNSTDFVALSKGDQLVASVAGQAQAMSESDLLNDVSYATTFA